MSKGFCNFFRKQKRAVKKQLFFAPVYAMPLRGGNFSLSGPVAIFQFKW
jgi:hypothetical protein